MKPLLVPEEKIIVALDGMSKQEVLEMVIKIPELRWVKIGLELFVCAGPSIFDDLRALNLHLFLDLKFHDIPATMAGVCRQAAKHGVELMTVHACAGHKALVESQASALMGAQEAGLINPTLLAVTILTSWQQREFSADLSINESLENRTLSLAKLAKEAGLGGCICSPQEVAMLRSIYPEPFKLITPGIRFKKSNNHDQFRVATAAKALKDGSSSLVIGRPITQADDPRHSFLRFCDDINSTSY
tara:strand:+ start:515 stop:1249 length:735 start_codon:yes stop_codon:yes gene_type:complete